MLLRGLAFCIFVLLKSSVCAPVHDDKVKPVLLAHKCMQIYTNGKLDNGTPILLLHGLSSSMEGWHGIDELFALKTGRRICVPDLRNHGSSPWNNRADVEAMTADIVELLDTLGVNKTIIVGQSLGGKIAVHTALRHPQQVEKIVVEDMRPNGITPEGLQIVKYGLKMILDALNAIPKGADELAARKAVLKYVNDKLSEVSPDLQNKMDISQLPQMVCRNGTWDWKANIRVLAREAENDKEFLTESSGRFKGPALFLYGTKSPFKVKVIEVD